MLTGGCKGRGLVGNKYDTDAEPQSMRKDWVTCEINQA